MNEDDLKEAVVAAAVWWYGARNHLGQSLDLTMREVALMDSIEQLVTFRTAKENTA